MINQAILSSTQEQFNNSSVDFKIPDAMIDPGYFIPFGKVGTTVVKATETIGSKSISVVAQKTGQLYDNVTLGAIGQANKIAPNLTNKYLGNPSSYTKGVDDIVNSVLPGIPANTKIGASAFGIYEMYNRDKEKIVKVYNKDKEIINELFYEGK